MPFSLRGPTARIITTPQEHGKSDIGLSCSTIDYTGSTSTRVSMIATKVSFIVAQFSERGCSTRPALVDSLPVVVSVRLSQAI